MPTSAASWLLGSSIACAYWSGPWTITIWSVSALCQSTALGFQLMISICFHLACCVCHYGFCSCQCLRVSRCWCCGCSQCFCFLVHGCCDFHCFCLCCMRCLPCPVSLCLGSTLCLEDSNARKNTQPLRLPSSKMRLRTSARWAINALASSAVPLWHQPSLRARGSFGMGGLLLEKKGQNQLKWSQSGMRPLAIWTKDDKS